VPLYPGALAAVRSNLELAAQGKKPPIVRIGILSTDQLAAINAHREEDELEPVVAEILFDGRHLYKSRCAQDGYSIEDVLDQIVSALGASSEVRTGWATVLRSRQSRVDRSGNVVRDEAVFECHSRHPNPELLSVIPKGDGKFKTEKKKATR
jgi:hypothetical protein